MESFVGKILKSENDEDYMVITELEYKKVPCVYAVKVKEDGSKDEKSFFQLTQDKDIKLVSIKSKKMVSALYEYLHENTDIKDIPRKIKDNESIADYLAYLDDFYKSKVITII